MSDTITNTKGRPPTEEEMMDTMQKANKIIADMQMEALRRFSMELRLNYLLGMIAKAMEKDGETEIDNFNDKVNWNKVNEIINLQTSPYDFNIYGEIKTIRELSNLREQVIYASCGLGPWQKHTCKDCGETFYMDKGEIDFFTNKELSIPVRCKSCREKRKKSHK